MVNVAETNAKEKLKWKSNETVFAMPQSLASFSVVLVCHLIRKEELRRRQPIQASKGPREPRLIRKTQARK
jgi:hypothetical protein